MGYLYLLCPTFTTDYIEWAACGVLDSQTNAIKGHVYWEEPPTTLKVRQIEKTDYVS